MERVYGFQQSSGGGGGGGQQQAPMDRGYDNSGGSGGPLMMNNDNGYRPQQHPATAASQYGNASQWHQPVAAQGGPPFSSYSQTQLMDGGGWDANAAAPNNYAYNGSSQDGAPSLLTSSRQPDYGFGQEKKPETALGGYGYDGGRSAGAQQGYEQAQTGFRQGGQARVCGVEFPFFHGRYRVVNESINRGFSLRTHFYVVNQSINQSINDKFSV